MASATEIPGPTGSTQLPSPPETVMQDEQDSLSDVSTDSSSTAKTSHSKRQQAEGKKSEAKDWTERVERQGPWNPEKDPLPLDGGNSLPMPVKIAEGEDLAPFFAHLRAGGTHEPTHTAIVTGDNAIVADRENAVDAEYAQQNSGGIPGLEAPNLPVPMLEFKKGVLYKDHRMDLCKMVVGPTHIDELLDSLETNTFVRHFLLGNNIIGPRGARRIARFVEDYPDRMETWYLAGNCIDSAGLSLLTGAFIKSSAITNVWLKRNPLTAEAAQALFRLLTLSPNLRTLDLDQTSLGDAGAATLFQNLAARHKPIALQYLYLNANGISVSGATQLSAYLSSPHCQLKGLYLSLNPLGNRGVEALAKGLASNASIEHLSIESVGMSSAGCISLLGALCKHPALESLSIGTAYPTKDLDARYNHFGNTTMPAFVKFIEWCRTLKFLDIGYTPMKVQYFNEILAAIAGCAVSDVDEGLVRKHQQAATGVFTDRVPSNLLYFFGKHGSHDQQASIAARTFHNKCRLRLQKAMRDTLRANVEATYPDTKVTVEEVLESKGKQTTTASANEEAPTVGQADENKKSGISKTQARKLAAQKSYEAFLRTHRRFLVSPPDIRLIDSVYRNRDAGEARRQLKWLKKSWDEGDTTLDQVLEG
ncbi:MAG: hypothetical protein M1831_001967 [Alyxoria varia]|nr:MAG: hypothetical protein M1831_001967 [Alyxoria varia]